MKTSALLRTITFLVILSAAGNRLFAHCEIPCGIYDDSLRVQLIAEHIGTVEKSMRTIRSLEKEKSVNYNQLVRWINNKEAHALKIQDIVTQYFLHQRIKPAGKDDKKGYDAYCRELTILHRMLIAAMKCKQTTDTAHIKELRELLKSFNGIYFKKK